MTVQRITMFKVANEADIPAFTEQYSTLEKNQQKVCLFARDHGTEEAQRLIHHSPTTERQALHSFRQRPQACE